MIMIKFIRFIHDNDKIIKIILFIHDNDNHKNYSIDKNYSINMVSFSSLLSLS